MTLLFNLAAASDVEAVVGLRSAVAQHLTELHGRGHWSCVGSEKSVLRDIGSSRVLLAWDGEVAVATVRLTNKRPWAINPIYFTPAEQVVYLTDMAVAPAWQRLGIGRRCLDHAKSVAADWPSSAIRLDAYDGPAGAGAFYASCGFTRRGRVTYRGTPLLYYELLL